MNPWNRSRLTAKLGIEHPIIQGPLGGLSSQRLTAAVSNYGGLGSFGAHTLTPAAITDVIAQIRSLTSQPFAMNLWVSMEDEGARTSDESAFNRSLAPLAAHLAELGAARPEYKPYVPTRPFEKGRESSHDMVSSPSSPSSTVRLWGLSLGRGPLRVPSGRRGGGPCLAASSARQPCRWSSW